MMNEELHIFFGKCRWDGSTHGAAVSKDGKEAVVLSAKPVVADE